jgi:bacterioferritin-associated ferredoxin
LLRRCLDQFYPPAQEFELPPDDETIVCRCEEVTAGEIRRVAALGCVGPNQGKAFTRCGMGPCMGRKCGVTVSRLIAEHHGLGMDEVGHYRIRPPVKPITVGQLAELEIDAHAHTA